MRHRAVSAPGTLLVLPPPPDVGTFVASADGSVWSVGENITVLSDDGSATTIATNVHCTDGAFFDSVTLLCSAPDGVKRIERSGAVTLIDPVPVSLVASANRGTVAFARGRTLGRFSRDGFVASFEIPDSVPSPLYSMTVGIDGSIWYPSGRDVVRITTPVDFNVFHGGSLFANRAPSTVFTEIEADPNGTVWLAINRDSRTSGFTRNGSIVSLTPDGAFHEDVVPTSPTRLRRTPDGSLWFIGTAGPGFLVEDPHLMRFMPGRGVTTVEVPGIGGFNGVIAFTVDTRGRLWLHTGSSTFGRYLVIRS